MNELAILGQSAMNQAETQMHCARVKFDYDASRNEILTHMFSDSAGNNIIDGYTPLMTGPTSMSKSTAGSIYQVRLIEESA